MLVILMILLIVLIILVGIVLIVVLVKKSNESKGEISSKDFYENIQTVINSINEVKNSSTEKIAEINNSLSKSLSDSSLDNIKNINELRDNVKTWIEYQSTNTQTKLDSSSSTLRTMLEELNTKTSPLGKVETTVNRLDNLLSQNNKAGKAGEYILSRLLSNWAGINKKNFNFVYKEQYKMKKIFDGNNLIVDAFIKGDGVKFTNIAIDSKLPFNNYEKMSQEKSEESTSYKENYNEFKKDVKKRVDETSKYVSDEDMTAYAIMFVPSESIYSFIVSHSDLIDYSFSKNVIIAGPSTMMSILHSVDKYTALFDNIKQYDKKLEILESVIRSLDNYDKSFLSLMEGVDEIAALKKDLISKTKTLRSRYEKLLKENE